jgi:hypothetical protein
LTTGRKITLETWQCRIIDYWAEDYPGNVAMSNHWLLGGRLPSGFSPPAVIVIKT